MRGKLLTWMLSAGVLSAQSADVPKRTLFNSSSQTAPKLVKPTSSPAEPAKPAPANDNSRGASSRALDTLNSSNEDLNLIRDGNVRGLTAGGCAPESSARIGDIASKLQASGVSLDGLKMDGLKMPAGTTARPGSEGAVLVMASDWYKRTGDASSTASGKDQKEALLDSVLPGATSSVSSGQDVAGLRTELDHLLASCAPVKR